MSYESLRDYIGERGEFPLNSSELRLARIVEFLGAGNGLGTEEIAYIIRAYNEVSLLKRRRDPRIAALEAELFGN